MVKRWLDRLKPEGWRGAQRVYAWSFFSQGTSDGRPVSDDSFLNEALRWFAVEYAPSLSPWDKGKQLADAVAASRTLLILDGVEPLQYPSGPQAGQLRATGLEGLLAQLVSGGQPGLCLITTRMRIRNLEEYERSDDHPSGTVVCRNLGNLSDTDGAELLHKLGVTCAGTTPIPSDDVELKQASRDVRNHALTLRLLGKYLKRAHSGNIRKRDQVKFEEADTKLEDGYVFQTIAAYERWLSSGGAEGAQQLAVLRCLGLFDRPASNNCLSKLRCEPVIEGLTTALTHLNETDWILTLTALADDLELIAPVSDNAPVDTHPLIREYFAKQLRESNPEAWCSAHHRLYEHLKDSVELRPSRIDDLEVLYQAVAHGSQTDVASQALRDYRERILRGEEFFSGKQFGLVGENLAAVANFFKEPWFTVQPSLTMSETAWLMKEAGFGLRALGRLQEAVRPLYKAVDMLEQLEDTVEAARTAGTLSELELMLGHCERAIEFGELSARYAEQSGQAFTKETWFGRYADALHQGGKVRLSYRWFGKAEEAHVTNPRRTQDKLDRASGFQYCDLLLAKVAVAAWRKLLGISINTPVDSLVKLCREVEQRANATKPQDSSKEKFIWALDTLTVGRCLLYRSMLLDQEEARDEAHEKINQAIEGIHSTNRNDFLPFPLLTRALLLSLKNLSTHALADLDEVWQIASRSDMRLHMADIHLHRARLFRDKEELNKARAHIEQCGYERRKEELEDAAEAAKEWG